MAVRCHACDKPLTADERRECTDQCFACNRETHAGRLAHHIVEDRITLARVVEMIEDELLQMAQRRERTPGR